MHALATLLTLVLISSGDKPEWGGFRGNNGAGLADSEGLPAVLGPEDSALWRVEVPRGYSSPTIAGERVFITGEEGTELITLCFDRATGDELWRRTLEFDGLRVGANSSAAPSPVTDGERVYALFHAAGLVVYDLKGEELWRKELGPFNIPHGLATSPLIHGERVVLAIDQDMGSFLIAFDKKSGEELWTVDRTGFTHSYSTPAIYQPAEGPAEVIVSGSLQVAAYSIEDGEKLWWVNGSAWQTKAIPVVVEDVCYVNAYMVAAGEMGMPRVSQAFEDALAEKDADGDGKIARSEWEHEMLHMAWFIFDLDGDDLLDEKDYEYLQLMGSATGGLFAIQLGGRGDVTESHLLWKFGDRRGLPDIPSPVVTDGLLYMIKEGGLMTAVDAGTGEVVKQARVGEPDQYFASPVAGDGKVVTASLSGQLAVVSAGPEWEVLSVARLEEEVWSTPAIAGGQVFVRSQEALWCFQDLSEE